MSKLKLKSLLEQQITQVDDENIEVPGIGVMSIDLLKQNVQNKAEDILSKIKRDNFDIGDVNLETFVHLMRVMKAVKDGQQPPRTTKIV